MQIAKNGFTFENKTHRVVRTHSLYGGSVKTFSENEWAVILGGSSGFGYATAHKLASEGMNICIVHRDRRAMMPEIEERFESLRALGARLIAFNVDALSDEGRTQVLDVLASEMGNGRVRAILHSIALGNLKMMVPHVVPDHPSKEWKALASKLNIDESTLTQAIDDVYQQDGHALYSVTTPPNYNEKKAMLRDADFQKTIFAMGTSLVSWVTDIFERKLFAPDARVLSLTSEGNEIAWRGYAAVSAAKVALESVTRAIAVEFAPYGIRCNVVQAGVTDTVAMRAIPGSAQMKSRAVLRNPFRRLTTPEDVADAIYLFCRKESGWINGALLRVDGGEAISG
jgi:NAD(P)-dependent dehydrogenase (short-subunit alcohol dehydrogenase family)